MDDIRPKTDLESGGENSSENKSIPEDSTRYLDGLRGLAALIVYLSHYAPWWYGIGGPMEHGFGYHGQYMFASLPFIRTIYTGGPAGVAIFFVLSGYVLSVGPLKMLKKGKQKETRLYLAISTVQRPFRLFVPLAAISLMFVLWLHLPFGLAPQLVFFHPLPTLVAELQRWVNGFAVNLNFFVEHGRFEHWFLYDPPSWTLAAELKGSLFLYAILAVSTMPAASCPRKRAASFAVVGIISLLVYEWELAAFTLGSVIAILDIEQISIMPERLAPFANSVYHTSFFVGWYILGQPKKDKNPELSYATPGWYYLTMLMPQSYWKNEFWHFWNVIGAVLLVFAVTEITWMRTFFNRPILRYLGKVSFSLYLIHYLIMLTISDRICRAMGVIRNNFTTPFDNLIKIPDWGPVGLSTGFIIWQAAVLPFNLFLASQATKRIDEPSVRCAKAIGAAFKGVVLKSKPNWQA